MPEAHGLNKLIRPLRYHEASRQWFAILFVPLVSYFGQPGRELLIAGSIGIYIVGVTVFSRQEVEKGSSVPLAFGLLLVSAGLAGMAFYGELAPMDWMKVRSEVRVLLIAAIGFSVVRRCFIAVRRPVPRNVRIAIKHCLLSLIVLDAAVAAQVAGAGWGAADERPTKRW